MNAAASSTLNAGGAERSRRDMPLALVVEREGAECETDLRRPRELGSGVQVPPCSAQRWATVEVSSRLDPSSVGQV
jgi:hypothetical protein